MTGGAPNNLSKIEWAIVSATEALLASRVTPPPPSRRQIIALNTLLDVGVAIDVYQSIRQNFGQLDKPTCSANDPKECRLFYKQLIDLQRRFSAFFATFERLTEIERQAFLDGRPHSYEGTWVHFYNEAKSFDARLEFLHLTLKNTYTTNPTRKRHARDDDFHALFHRLMQIAWQLAGQQIRYSNAASPSGPLIVFLHACLNTVRPITPKALALMIDRYDPKGSAKLKPGVRIPR